MQARRPPWGAPIAAAVPARAPLTCPAAIAAPTTAMAWNVLPAALLQGPKRAPAQRRPALLLAGTALLALARWG